MKSIFAIQDKEKEAIGATFPFFASKGTEVTIKAGPIEKEYLPKNLNK
jgi:hypothetical protein